MKTDFNGIKIGRLKMTVAKAINRRCADIYISESYINHIENRHKKEIEKVGFSVVEYVKTIISNFNQIRKGSGNSILLIICNEELNHVAAIDMNYCTKKGVWEVKTAQPRRWKEIKNLKLLW